MTVDNPLPADLSAGHRGTELEDRADGKARRGRASMTAPAEHRAPAAPWQGVIVRRVQLLDVTAVLAAIALGYVLRIDRGIGADMFEPRGGQYALISVVLAQAWVLVLGVVGSRSLWVLGSGREEYLRVVRATVAIFGLTAIICYLVQFDLARSYVAVTLLLGIALLVGGRWLLARRSRVELEAARARRVQCSLPAGPTDLTCPVPARSTRRRAS